ncbi:HNH endonuclease [Streptomyces sp. NPDC058751]|uniref:HNH endonuclease n=1 Tax=Streptomyces sp. NPDC058751 TaxID=3346623 RepID=UPI0036A03C0A
MGKTIEVGLTAAEIVGLRPLFVHPVIPDGHHRVLGLGRQWWEEVARYTDHGAGTARAEVPPWPQSFARDRIREWTVPPRERYRELRRRVEEREAEGRHQEHAVTAGVRRVRDREARQAVLLRSEGLCENPWCFLPLLPYRTAAGSSLLEVDHIDDHALGGRDHPSAMIALCPNCHANKTRGTDGTVLRESLRAVARELDAAQNSDAVRDKGAMQPRSEAVLAQCAALLASLDHVDRDRVLTSLTSHFG